MFVQGNRKDVIIEVVFFGTNVNTESFAVNDSPMEGETVVRRRGFMIWFIVLVAGAGVFLALSWNRLVPAASVSPDGAGGGGTSQAAETVPEPDPVPPTEGEPLLSFFILSDLHINGGVSYPSEHLKKALDDIKSFGPKAEALIITGDLTESGTESDYKELRSILNKYKLPPVYVNMGNHDYYNVWIDQSGAFNKDSFPNGKTDAESRETFLKFFNLKKPYYDVKVKGYRFLLLSQETYRQEKPEVDEGAWYSDEQLQWFRTTMAESKDGKPVFVMIHQPLPAAGQDGGSHRLIPARKFRDILKPYLNVFVFSGHTHQDFHNGAPHYLKETFHWFTNSSTARVLNKAYNLDNENAAQGLYVQVFADKVILRGREFSNRTWIGEAQWTVPLKPVK